MVILFVIAGESPNEAISMLYPAPYNYWDCFTTKIPFAVTSIASFVIVLMNKGIPPYLPS